MNFLNIDTAKSYATEANLVAGLKKLGLDHEPHMIVRNRAGRFTAIFSIGMSSHRNGGYIAFASAHGFKTFG